VGGRGGGSQPSAFSRLCESKGKMEGKEGRITSFTSLHKFGGGRGGEKRHITFLPGNGKVPVGEEIATLRHFLKEEREPPRTIFDHLEYVRGGGGLETPILQGEKKKVNILCRHTFIFK